jgi:hypothetical protein
LPYISHPAHHPGCAATATLQHAVKVKKAFSFEIEAGPVMVPPAGASTRKTNTKTKELA